MDVEDRDSGDSAAMDKIKMHMEGANFMRAFVLRATILAKEQERRDRRARREKIKSYTLHPVANATRKFLPYLPALVITILATLLMAGLLELGVAWVIGDNSKHCPSADYCELRRSYWKSVGREMPGDPPAVRPDGYCTYYPSPPGMPGASGPPPWPEDVKIPQRGDSGAPGHDGICIVDWPD